MNPPEQQIDREADILLHLHNPDSEIRNLQTILNQYLKDLTNEHETNLGDQRQRIGWIHNLRETYHHRREGYLQELAVLKLKWRTDEIVLQETQLNKQIWDLEAQRQEILGKIQRAQEQHGLQVVEANREQWMNGLRLSHAQQVHQVRNADRCQLVATERKRPIATDEARGRSTRRRRLDAGNLEISSDLQPGEVYEIRREDGNFYPGILLPLVDLEEIGISGSVATLLQYTFDPMCYRYEGDQIAGWRDGYEDGGPLVDQRRHPVLLLDENEFPVPPPEARFELPERPVYEWAAARDFRGLPQSKVASMDSRFKNPVTLFRERLQAVISEGGTKRVAGRVKASRLNDGQASPLVVNGSSAGNDAQPGRSRLTTAPVLAR